MNLIRKTVLIKIGLLLISVLIIILILQNHEKNSCQRVGDSLIDKIEVFRKTENRLPDSVAELGLEEPMNSGPYYEKKDSADYVVYFSVGFDETFIYHSKENKWVWE